MGPAFLARAPEAVQERYFRYASATGAFDAGRTLGALRWRIYGNAPWPRVTLVGGVRPDPAGAAWARTLLRWGQAQALKTIPGAGCERRYCVATESPPRWPSSYMWPTALSAYLMSS
jgi:hypothetical protein